MSDSPWLDGAVVVTRQGEITPEKPEAKPSENFYANRFKRGLASGVGAIADTPARIANLAVAGSGGLAALMGQNPASLRQLPFDPNKFTGVLQNAMGSGDSVEPTGRGQAILGAATEGAGAALSGGLPMAGALNTAKTLPGMIAQYLATQGAMGAGAGAGSEIGGQVAGPAGSLIGGLAGGVVTPSSFIGKGGLVLGGGRAAYNTVRDTVASGQAGEAAAAKAGPIVEKMVNNQLRQSVAGTPNAANNIDDALALRQKIQGFNPSVAEMTGSKGAAQMQSKYALTSPERLNSEVARTEANQKAIQDYYQSVAPEASNPSAIRSGVNQSVADAGKSALANESNIGAKLTIADQLGIGSKLGELALGEKNAARPAITAAYEKAFKESGNVETSAAPIVSKVEDILGTTLSKIKPETAPQTVSTIKRIFGDKTTDATGRSIPPDMMALSDVKGKTEASLRDLHDIRVAIGQDMASAGRSLDPTAATRLYNLNQVLPEIDAAIAKLPGAAAYDAAKAKYSTEYAPRFKEGTNLQVFKDKSNNEPRILPDKFVSEFLKPDASAGVSRSLQFNNLFGTNAEAKNLANQGILDIYRQKVVDPTTGVINQNAHAAFLRDYGRTLHTFDTHGIPAIATIKRIGSEASQASAATQRLEQSAKALKYDTVDQLVDGALANPRVMANTIARIGKDVRPQLERLVMDRAMQDGTSKKMVEFISKHENTLKIALQPAHSQALQDIAKAYQITERAPLRGNTQTGGPDVLKNATDVSTATLWSQVRAWTGGRQGPATMVFNLAAPVLNRLSRTKFSDVMENALHNPETAIKLRDMLRATNPNQANMAAQGLLDSMKDVGRVIWSARGPALKHFVGAENYPVNFARSGGAIAGNMQEQNQQQ